MPCANCGAQQTGPGPLCAECGQPLFAPQASGAAAPAASRPPIYVRSEDLREAPSASYFARHWRGELSLPVSYWINGVALGLVLALVARRVFGNTEALVVKHPQGFSLLALASFVALGAFTVWQLVGIFRSARRYLAEGRSKLWGSLAMVAVVIGLVNGVRMFATEVWPTARTIAPLALGSDPLGRYQLRLLEDATELEVSGPITFGLSADAAQLLDANPSVRFIHLNSLGGRVTEARALRDLIQARQLITYTATHCASACTLAYMAGKERWIAAGGVLAFHQYSVPGLDARAFRKEYERDRADWMARGIDARFVQRAFLTPNAYLWKPTLEELVAANVVTREPDTAEEERKE